MTRLPKITFQSSFILLVILLVLSYALFEASMLVQGPHVAIALPKNELQQDALLTISGTTKNVTWIALLGKPIHISEEGAFREELLIPVGYSVLTIEARDRFGRSVTETIEVVRDTPKSGGEVLTTASTSPTTPS